MREPVFINLGEAYLCTDREALGNSATRCPRCQSQALINVRRAIPRHCDSIRIICSTIEEQALSA
jgi:DNA-directed RNA polymerase subunit RPC12/RpoP